MNWLIDLINQHSFALTVASILVVTYILWQIFDKMAEAAKVSDFAAVIRAIILARGPDGATLQDIKSKFS